MVADVYGTICGSDIPATRDQPAEGRYISDMRIEVLGINITDALPPELVNEIEYRILEGDYA
ncbi:MAG: hypothetical protein KGH65_03690 [Candidatus Micrarchaeota archaeon]|nr:hypothetical protein [Candidatus Micrarchaeota archaeon]